MCDHCIFVDPRIAFASATLQLVGKKRSLIMGLNEGSGAIFGISEKIGCGLAMANKWSNPPVQIIMSFAFGVPGLIATMVLVAVYVSIFAVPLVWVALYGYYQYVFLATPSADTEKYITFKARHLTSTPHPATGFCCAH